MAAHRVFVLLAGLCLLIVPLTVSTADTRTDPSGAGSPVHSGPGVEWNARSYHVGLHSGTCVGWDCAYASHASMPASEHELDGDGNVAEYSLKKRGRLYYATPFTGLQRTSAESCASFHNNSNRKGWLASMNTTKDWIRTGIAGSDGRVSVFYGSQNTVSSGTTAAHTNQRPPTEHVPFAPRDDVALLSVDFYDNGVAQLDENGDLVYDVPPAIVACFTSELEFSETSAEYTYTLENLTSESRSFDIPQVTSPLHPNGWSGTVVPNDEEVLVLTVQGEPAWVQNCQIELEEMDFGGTYALPCEMYVTASRRDFTGGVDINSITTSQSGSNLVNFTVTGATATKVVLWWIGQDDSLELVAEEEGAWSANSNHTLEDPSPATGENTYMVMVGTEPNGAESYTASIVN